MEFTTSRTEHSVNSVRLHRNKNFSMFCADMQQTKNI